MYWGGALNFFSVCSPDFRTVWGFANWHLPLKGGLVSGKFPNLGACELKISKFGGLWAKIWVKIEAVEAKISKFYQKGVLWTDSCLKWNPCERQERREKGVFRAAHPHTPFLGQCPPPPGDVLSLRPQTNTTSALAAALLVSGINSALKVRSFWMD